MESSSSSTNAKSSTPSTTRPSKCLLFDRRYGWVIDEWKHPSQEALAGGRGMFCILPLAKSFLHTASQSINLAANFAVKVFERPDLFSPQVVKANLDQQVKKFNSTLRKQEINCLHLMGQFPSQTRTFPSHVQMRNEDLP